MLGICPEFAWNSEFARKTARTSHAQKSPLLTIRIFYGYFAWQLAEYGFGEYGFKHRTPVVVKNQSPKFRNKEREISPKSKFRGRMSRRRARAYPRRPGGQKLRSGPQNPGEKNTHVGADIHGPIGADIHDSRGFKRSSVRRVSETSGWIFVPYKPHQNSPGIPLPYDNIRHHS